MTILTIEALLNFFAREVFFYSIAGKMANLKRKMSFETGSE